MSDDRITHAIVKNIYIWEVNRQLNKRKLRRNKDDKKNLKNNVKLTMLDNKKIPPESF